MDSDAHSNRRVVVAALSRDRSPPGDRRSRPRSSALICPRLAQTGSTSATSWSETFKPDRQASFSGLIGTLVLRAIRDQHKH